MKNTERIEGCGRNPALPWGRGALAPLSAPTGARAPRPQRIAFVFLAVSGLSSLSAQIGMPRGLMDHSLCCGIRPAGINGEVPQQPAAELSGRRALLQPSSPTPSIPAQPATLEKVDGYVRVGFDVLGGFEFTAPTDPAETAAAGRPSALTPLPAQVRGLDGQKVRVRGYMLPLKMEGPRTTEFLLLASSMLCCYGVVPAMNQWIVVRTPEGVEPLQDVPLEFQGTLHVKERFEHGMLSAIYQLDGENRRPGK